MNIKIKELSLALVAASIIPSGMASAANVYNIEYDGGEPLSADNVQINPTLVNGLSTLMQMDDVNIKASSSNLWKDGYISDMDDCLSFKYFAVPRTNTASLNNKLGVTISKDQYTAEVKFNKIVLDMSDDDTDESLFAVGFTPGYSFIYGGWKVYSDSTCEQPAEGLRRLNPNDDNELFIDMTLKLYKANQESVFVTNGLYFGITDIDAAQSYKILNTNNGLVSENMFAKSAEDLQNDVEGSNLKNMFVESDNGNYIYSQYSDAGSFNTDNKANIYLTLNRDTQQNGLNLVFGFGQAAASGIEYYAKQYIITYKSDKNGKITDIEQEKVIDEDNPSGSESEPNKGNKFLYWIADKDVVLDDGTIIKAGDPIDDDQIKRIVVTEDLEFTAIHDKASPATPDTGASTGEINAIQFSISIAGILACVALVYIASRLAHKKVNFN